MLSNYYTFRYLASTLKARLQGRLLEEAYSQERDRLVLRYGQSALIIACERTINTLWLREEFARARINSVDLFPSLIGRTLSDVTMLPGDRVVIFTFDNRHRLEAWFFGARSNVVLVNQDGEILDAFKQRSDFIGTRPEYRAQESVLDFDALRASLHGAGDQSMQSVMKLAFPLLSSTLVREVLYRAGIPSSALASHIGDEHLEALRVSLASLVADLEEPQPRLYVRTAGDEQGAPEAFSLIPLMHLLTMLPDVREEKFDNVHEAVARYVAIYHAYTELHEVRRRVLEKLNSTIARLQRTIQAVEAELSTASRAEEYSRHGTLLMSYLHQLPRGAAEARIESGGTEVVIPLEQHLTPVQNAQRYFEKAKQARARRTAAQQRLASLHKALDGFKKLTEQFNAIHSHQELKQFMRVHRTDLQKLGLNSRATEQERFPFRVFRVDGGFEVWAGKSSTNNDELTFKHAKPNDLWFHARGASGSHVILKVNSAKGYPSKKAKEQAAAIAAYYSKMRNAKMVPVAMTERKYVRKPKGAPPGTVIVEREKVIFSEPALPHEEP